MARRMSLVCEGFSGHMVCQSPILRSQVLNRGKPKVKDMSCSPSIWKARQNRNVLVVGSGSWVPSRGAWVEDTVISRQSFCIGYRYFCNRFADVVVSFYRRFGRDLRQREDGFSIPQSWWDTPMHNIQEFAIFKHERVQKFSFFCFCFFFAR